MYFHKLATNGRGYGARAVLFLLAFGLVLAGTSFGGEPGEGGPPKRRPDKPAPGAPRPQNPNRGKVRKVTDENFDRAIKKGVSSVYFWAEWCGPCRLQGPIMDDMAKKYAGKVKVLKLDIDSELEVRGKYDIRQVPTTIVFKNGKPVVKMIGLIDAEEYSEEIDALIKPKQGAPAKSAAQQ